jgi:hypothetical protein
MKIALGLTVRNLNENVNILNFLENAKKYNHTIDEVIIVYSGSYDEDLADKIEEYTQLKLLKINHCHELTYRLKENGLDEDLIKDLIYSDIYDEHGLIPYGKNRHNVLIQAIVDKMDVLFFVDDDVKPSVLIENGTRILEVEIDFFSEHLNYLEGDVYVTSSDYSGYYIVPPMRFKNMEYLIRGLQKGAMFNKSFVYEHGYLTVDKFENRSVSKTDKVLGGNLAMRLEIFNDILPFFSSVYEVRGKHYLTRGEDTLLGLDINNIEDKFFLDIDVKIFHDTFDDFPTAPCIMKDQSVKDRFFYACMGWIGRNPFLNWLLERNLEEYYERTRKALVIGAPAIAEHLDDRRFYLLPEALDQAYLNLDKMIVKYYKLRNNWREFMKYMK